MAETATPISVIETADPKVVPAQLEQTYDKYYVEMLVIRSPDPGGNKHTLDATLRLGRKDGNTWTFDPSEPPKKISIPNVFAVAAESPEAAAALGFILAALQKYGREQNILR